MAVREIKSTISLDGEAKFRAALKAAQRELKVTQTALQAETAAFGKNSSSMEANAAKAKNLQKQIQQQKAIVDALTKAVEDSAKAHGENSAATDHWRIKLNQAQRDLNNMINAEAEASTGMTKLGESVTGATAKLGIMQGIGQKIGSTLTTAAKNGIKAIWDLASNAGAAADQINTMATNYNADPKYVQFLQQYTGQMEISANDYFNAQNRVWSNRSNVGAIAAIDASLLTPDMTAVREGVTQEQLFRSLLTAAGANEAFFTSGEGADAFQALFGRNYADLKTLMQLMGNGSFDNAWTAYQEGPRATSAEDLAGAQAFNDASEELANATGALQKKVGSKFATWMTPYVESLTKGVDDISSIVNGNAEQGTGWNAFKHVTGGTVIDSKWGDLYNEDGTLTKAGEAYLNTPAGYTEVTKLKPGEIIFDDEATTPQEAG